MYKSLYKHEDISLSFIVTLTELRRSRLSSLDILFNKIKKREEKRKILFVLSDGAPEESPQHRGFDLKQIVKKIEEDKDVHIIGLGIGSGTEHVKKFYKDNIANVDVKEFSEKLAEKLRQVIEG